jgi:hypothetical protein
MSSAPMRKCAGRSADQSKNDSAASSVFSISVATVIGPTPPGTGVIQAARSAALANSTSPTRLPSLAPVDTDIDDNRTLLDPFTLDQIRPAHGDHDDVGIAHESLQALGEAMAHGGGAAGQQEFECERAAHVVGNTDHDRMLAAYWKVRIGQQCHHSFRGTRAQTALAKHQAPDVFRLETIHVFLRIDAVDQGIGIDMCRQGQLHEDAVDTRVRVEAIDQRRQFGFRRVGWQIEIMEAKPTRAQARRLLRT